MQLSRLFKTGALALVTSLALTGCDIDLSDSKDNNAAAIAPQKRTLTGYVTDGDANGNGGVVGATIWVGDRNGKLITTTTDGNGSFTANISGMAAPVVVRASFTPQGESTATVWYSLVENPSNNSVVGINSFTNVVLSYEILAAYGVLGDGPAPAPLMVTATDLGDLSAAAKYNALVNAGIFDGIGSGSLDLSSNMNRAQFARVAALLFDLNTNPPPATTFTDLPAANWYFAEIMAFQRPSLPASDLASTAFSPSNGIDREELARILAQTGAFSLQTPPPDLPASAGVSDWASSYVSAALTAGLIGTPVYTNPADRRDLLQGPDYSNFLQGLNNLGFFKLKSPSSWNVEVHVQGDDIDPIDAFRQVSYTGSGIDIPLNEDQLLLALQNELKSRFPGRIEFTGPVELHAKGTGEVGSQLSSSAITGKVTLAGQTRSFFIESFSAERFQ